MGYRLELTDHSYLEDSRKTDGPVFCKDVRSWGFLAARTPSEKDFYHDDISNNPGARKVGITVTGHFFCQKYDSTNTPTVLAVKLFLDESENPSGFDITKTADMLPEEHFAEWRMQVFINHLNDSEILLFRVTGDDVWFHGMPPIPSAFTPWEILYNLFVIPFKTRP